LFRTVWATCFKNSTYTCLGMALYGIHTGGILTANFYVGLFMHVFLVFPNIIHCHIWKRSRRWQLLLLNANF
jgi:hypothetical protein